MINPESMAMTPISNNRNDCNMSNRYMKRWKGAGIDVASISLVASNQNSLWNKYPSRADSWSSAKGRTLSIDLESSIRSYFPAIDFSALLATLLPPIQRWNIDQFCATLYSSVLVNLWYLDISRPSFSTSPKTNRKRVVSRRFTRIRLG